MSNIADLNLSGVTADGNGPQAGGHELVIENAIYEIPKSGSGRMLVLRFRAEDGSVVYERLCVFHDNPRAQTISRAKLRTILRAGKHPTPEQPGEIESLIGLRMRGVIVMNGDWPVVKKYSPLGE